MSEISIYTVNTREAKSMIAEIIGAGLVPYLHSSPGMGKSSINAQVAKDYNLKLIDHRLSTSGPEDLSGLPRFNSRGRAEFSPFEDLFPLDDDEVPKGYDGWMLFLDEFPAASKQVQAAAFKLVLDKMTGQRRLNERVAITAAGNLMSDKSIVNPLSTAMQSRVIHLEMIVNFDIWLQDVAIAEKYDHRIIAFLNQYNGKLMDFDPKHTNKTFCCPRTWEFMNRLVKGKEVAAAKAAMYAGTITPFVAAEFIEFCKVYKDLVTLDQILRDPDNCPISQDLNIKWATIGMMADKITDDNFGGLATYANRYDLSFRVLFFRMAMMSSPKLRKHSAFVRATIELQRYLNG